MLERVQEHTQINTFITNNGRNIKNMVTMRNFKEVISDALATGDCYDGNHNQGNSSNYIRSWPHLPHY